MHRRSFLAGIGAAALTPPLPASAAQIQATEPYGRATMCDALPDLRLILNPWLYADAQRLGYDMSQFIKQESIPTSTK